MSWLQKVKNDLIIQCGDGKQYKPAWINASFQVEYNTAEFNFPNVKGTKVDQGEIMGRKFSLEIFFQGDDHLDISNAFFESTKDRKPWAIQHPYYGIIYVKPASLSFENNEANISKIAGTILETILDDNPKVKFAPAETVKIKDEELDVVYEDALTEIPSATDIKVAKAGNLSMYSKGVPIIEIPEEFESYYNLFNTANSYATTAIATPLLFMRSIVAFIKYPSLLSISVKSRIDQLVKQWETLKATVEGLFGVGSKQIFQNKAAANISAMCYASATPLAGNYTNSVDVLTIIDKIKTVYSEYIESLDLVQNDNGGNPDYFIPNADVLFKLTELVNITIANLFDIALNAKQQRIITLAEDTNIILLTHKLYGLDEQDNNMNELMINNSMSLNDILVIKKETKIYYYI